MKEIFDPTFYAFSIYSVPNWVTGAAILTLGLMALIRERGSAVSILFLLMAVTVAIWLFGFSAVYAATDARVALWWVKAAHLGVALIPAAVYHFTVAILRIYREHKLAVWAGWLNSALFFATVVGTDAFIAG
jgi:hypothetical protein